SSSLLRTGSSASTRSGLGGSSALVRLEEDEADGMSGLLLPDQRMEKPEPPGITSRIRGFQDRGCQLKTCVIDEGSECRESDGTPPDVCMPVHPRSAGTKTVVEVETADPPPAEATDGLVHHRLRSGLAGQVIPRREEMAGVQTDADTAGCIDTHQDLLQVLEPVPETVALTGRDFEAHPGRESGQRAVDLVERLRHQPQSAPGRRMRSGVKDQGLDPESRAAEQLLPDRLQAARANDWVLRREVHQIAPVSDRRHPDLSCRAVEGASLLGRERGTAPRAARSGEDLDRAGTVLHTATEGERDPARDRLVRSESHGALLS